MVLTVGLGDQPIFAQSRMGRKVDGQWEHPIHVAGRFGPVRLASNKLCVLCVPRWSLSSVLMKPPSRDVFVPISDAVALARSTMIFRGVVAVWLRTFGPATRL